jgi:hypothetical protein
VVLRKVATQLEVQQSREQDVVADGGVAVEREVRGIQGDVVLDEPGEARMGRPDDRSQAAPEHSVVDEEKIGALRRRHSHRGLAEVYGSPDPGDLTRIAHLEPVEGFGSVSDFLFDAEVAIEIADERV